MYSSHPAPNTEVYMKRIRNSCLFAFLQGFFERVASNGDVGRTHPTNQDWNEAYDRGMNLAERFV